MIYLLHGENLFKRDEELARITDSGEVERYMGSEIDQSRMVDVFAGGSLFSSRRTVVIDGLSANKVMWAMLPGHAEGLDDSTNLVLIENRLDKRTKTYKLLQKQAKLIDCSPWTVRQTREAENWLRDYANARDIKLSPDQVCELVSRAIRQGLDDQPMIDQALLATVVGQLRYAERVDLDVINAVMTAESHDNVFGLLDTALSGDSDRLAVMIERLRHHQDGHRIMALLSSQAIQLSGLVLARSQGAGSTDKVADDLGAHPYALRQLTSQAQQLSAADIERLIERLAWADERLKRGARPWQIITIALQTINHPV